MTTTEGMCRAGLHPVEERNSSGCRPCANSSRAVRDESRTERLKRMLREVEPQEPGWQVRGLCAGGDPTDWSLNDDPNLSGGEIERINNLRHERAKRVCERCPVRKSCLDHALLSGHPWGTWGGVLFTSTDIEPMRQARKELASE